MVIFANRFVGDIDLCMDIVQDSFLSAYNSISTFDRTKNEKTWLYTIVRNKCLDYLRKEKIRAKYASLTYDDFDENGRWVEQSKFGEWEESNLLDNPMFVNIFRGCIENLPGTMPSVITLRYIDDMDAIDICENLNLTKSNYWQIVHRAKLKLRKCLEKNWFFEKRNR